MDARSSLGIAAVLLTSACAHPASTSPNANVTASSSGSASTAPSASNQGLPIAAMHLDLVSGTQHHALAELRDDGSIYANGQLVARISGTQLVRADGTVVVAISPDGTLTRDGRPVGPALGAHGELLSDEGRVEIAPDHTVVAIANDGTREPTGLQFDRVPDEARRTAGLLVFVGLAMMPRRNAHDAPPVAIPSHTSGALAASDIPLSDGSVADDYRLTLRAGHPVTIVVRGGTQTSAPEPVNPNTPSPSNGRMDMYTILMFNGNEVTHDDDSAGSFNSRIVFTPTVDGDYTIRITTYGAGLRTGDYEIDVLDGAVPTAH